MPAHTAVSPQSLIEAARAAVIAYNEKNWDKVRASVTPDFDYDEVPTRRRVHGAEPFVQLCQGWAQAFPDSKATFHGAIASGETVVQEVTWKGTHQGALQTPKRSVPATGKRIEVRACLVMEMAGDKVKSERHYFDLATLLEQVGA